MKIYFAGSIRAGRDDILYYSQIINYLKKYGDVLTEHIGSPDLSEDGEKKPVRFIYRRDMNWIKGADILIADVTQPSVGVGYEVRYAEELGKPVLCLYRIDGAKKVSGMIEGNINITLKRYKSLKSIDKVLKQFFDNLYNVKP